MEHSDWPALQLAAWEDTYRTLHRWTQIVGKVRLRNAPWLNHWWHTTMLVTPRGLATTSTPCSGRELNITFDFCSHELVVQTSDSHTESIALSPMSVAEFYGRAIELFTRLGADVRIWPTPVEVADTTPFPEDTKHASYDRKQVEALHRILMSVDRVFNAHRGRFLGKSSPSHFFWGAFDLAVTRFSGRRNPQPPEDTVMREAYSHEVISHGFWPGGDWPNGDRLEEAVFYAYESPAPAGLNDAKVRPKEAAYSASFGEFLLPYDAVRRADDPDAMLLEFMETTYVAAAKLGDWDVENLQHPRFRE